MLPQQVCPELTHEAVEYEESSASDGTGPLCMVLAIDVQTSQQQMESLKKALLEVCLLMGSPKAHTHVFYMFGSSTGLMVWMISHQQLASQSGLRVPLALI